MPLQVVNMATLACTGSLAPGELIVTPEKLVFCLSEVAPAANILDFVPLKNIMSFGMCMSPANPAFIAATSAALGTPTPVPCVPVVTTPWAPGAVTVMVGPAPALHMACTNMCMWAGVITITNAGQVTVNVT